MLILVTHANHLYADRKQVRKMQPYPPLQTLIAAAVLRRAGHEVAFLDTTFNNDFATAFDRVRPELVLVCEDNFNFLTKMCTLENRNLAFAMARATAERGIPAIVNSSDASDHPTEYLEAGFHQVIVGEIENALVDFETAGIRRGVPVADLNALPSPAWALLDIEPYRSAWQTAHGHFSLNLVASRGCPYHCNWCAKPLFGSSYRTVSPASVAREIARVRQLFAPDDLWFADDIFGLSAQWTAEFAALVDPIPFRMQSRCDLMTRPVVASLAQAGCTEVWMGVESGSQKILDAMEKGTRVEDIRAARENLRRHGIRAGYFLQLGYLGEEWDDIEATIRLVRETSPDDIGVSVSYPLPNTRFHQIVAAGMGPQANWRDSGDLAAMFQTTFPSDLYRAVADALHREVRGEDAAPVWDKVEQLRCACC